MRAKRVFPGLAALTLVGVGFVACGGKVSVDESDGGIDAAPTTKPTTTTTPTPTSTVKPPSCPTYRPIRGTPCPVGLSCFYDCAPGQRSSIRATCPSTGTWTIAEVEPCGAPPPPVDCETCQRDRCGAQIDACRATDATVKGCNALITCINACPDTTCQNKCISDSTSTEGKALVECVVTKCADFCG